MAPDGGWWLAVARACSVAALLSVFGTLLFRAVVPPRAVRDGGEVARVERNLRAMARASAATCLVATLVWLVLQAADLASAASVAGAVAAVPRVLARTWFGHLILLQLAMMAALLVLQVAWPSRWVLPAVAAVTTVLQAGHSHALAMDPGLSLLLVSDALHLLAAGAWLGGLAPLLMVVACLPARTGAAAARWFSPYAKLCVVLLAATAGVQGWIMIASVPGLVGTDYGRVAMVKLALLGVLLAFAVLNRYRLAPDLLRDPQRARRRLILSIVIQTGFGVAVIAAAAVLSGLPPAMHTQPLWPFAWQPSLDPVREDADFRHEVLAAAAGLAAAAALLVLAVLARRWRWPAVALAVVAAAVAAPHLDLLFVDATPTSFYHSPTGFSADAIVAGAAAYPPRCAACHGAEGRGDGPLAKRLPIPPADLTAAHLWMHSDGELFWWVSHGIAAPDGTVVMPGFATSLSEDQVWGVIDFLHAQNGGMTRRDTGLWRPTLHAPDFAALCGGRPTSLHALRGHAVRLVIGPAPSAEPGIIGIGTAPGAAGGCTVSDDSVPQAYAIAAGMPAAKTVGSEFLIDAAGWLRAEQTQDAPRRWDDPAKLAAALAEIDAEPIAGVDDDMGSMPMHMPMNMSGKPETAP